MKELVYALLNPDAKPPQRESHSAGYDLFAFGDHCINFGDTSLIPLGFFAALEEGYAAFLWDRSSMGVAGVHRFAGLIDWSYRLQWKAVLHNFSRTPLIIHHGDKIVQAAIQKVELPILTNVSLEDFQKNYPSERKGGFGTTGGVPQSHWKKP